MMKKTIISALVLLLAAGPAFADGHGRKSPKCCKHKNSCCVKKAGGLLVDGLEFVVKLPFRLVTATAEGLYDLTVHQELGGFEDGYKRI